MSSSKRLLLRAATVVVMGGLTLLTAPTAEAAAASICDANFCTNDIADCDPSLCFFCAPGVYTQCDIGGHCFNEDYAYHVYCGYET